MVYRLFYLKEDLHDGMVFETIEKITITNLKDAKKYRVYYLTDINGNIIIDNRKRSKKL